MPDPLKFEHAGRSFEARAENAGQTWTIRVYAGDELATNVEYSVSAGADGGVSAELVHHLMHHAQRDIEKGLTPLKDA